MHKSVKDSKSEENQMSSNKKDLPVLNPDSEDIGSSAEPSRAQAHERANGAAPESHDKAAAGLKGCSFCSLSYSSVSALNKHIRKHHNDEWINMKAAKYEAN